MSFGEVYDHSGDGTDHDAKARESDGWFEIKVKGVHSDGDGHSSAAYSRHVTHQHNQSEKNGSYVFPCLHREERLVLADFLKQGAIGRALGVKLRILDAQKVVIVFGAVLKSFALV